MNDKVYTYEDKIVSITDVGDLKLKRRRRSNSCNHLSMVIDSETETIECDSCGLYLSPFKALTILMRYFDRAQSDIAVKKVAVEELQQKTLHLKAARLAESAWRRRDLVPVCPHCKQAIFADDRFGSRLVSKSRALEARRFSKK